MDKIKQTAKEILISTYGLDVSELTEKDLEDCALLFDILVAE